MTAMNIIAVMRIAVLALALAFNTLADLVDRKEKYTEQAEE